MTKDKKCYELQALDFWDFPELLHKAREIQGIALETLCKDICSYSMMGRMEKGERLLSKELRDRVLARLGVCSDGYENFLFREDYIIWKMKQRIVNAIEKSDYQTAEELLEYYNAETENNEENKYVVKIRRQFALVMKAQIMQKRHGDRAAIAELCEEAVKQTVPDIDNKSVNELCLSVHELDMALEYARYCHAGKLASRCEEILEYIESDIFDTYSYVKIYPKVIYYLYTSTADEDRDWNRLLRLVNVGIEQLRTVGRMYYLYELLEIRKEGMEKLLSDIGDSRGDMAKQALEKMINTTTEWLGALDFVHDMCKTHRRMETSCYLYQQKEAYCISDVVKRRREMLGLTKKELCEGICSEKTIGRLEAGKTKPQMAIVKQLFERLNLSGEYQRGQIVTNDVMAYEMVDDIGRYINNRDFETARNLLEELKVHISLEKPMNIQYIERIETNIKLGMGEFEKGNVVNRLKGILEYTLPYETVIRTGVKYLTNVEIQCLLDIAVYMGGRNVAYNVLKEFCKQLEYDEGISEHIVAWTTVMTNIANICGDVGEYDESNEISLSIIKECVYCYRMNLLELNLYIIAWNNEEKIKKNIPVLEGYNTIEYINQCIVLSQINKDKIREKLLREKLNILNKIETKSEKW